MPINQSINQSFIHSFDQTIKHLIIRSINQSINQSDANLSTYQAINQSIEKTHAPYRFVAFRQIHISGNISQTNQQILPYMFHDTLPPRNRGNGHHRCFLHMGQIPVRHVRDRGRFRVPERRGEQ